MNQRIICLESFHKEGHHTLQKIQTKFLFLKLSLTFTKIRFSQVLLLDGIISIKSLRTVKVLPCSAIVS